MVTEKQPSAEDSRALAMFDQLVAAGADPDDAQAAAQILAVKVPQLPGEMRIVQRVWGQLMRAGRIGQ